MYVVKVSDFLQMEGPPQAHDALMEQGLLHEWWPGMFVIFVSHQWLGTGHPDPCGAQTAVLRQAFSSASVSDCNNKENASPNMQRCYCSSRQISMQPTTV
ncbi:unnamed protein product [Symbiodinium pilosum]|uniref:Uncharacterized protein n=1 Tax=Symbiodinium pilosum TaxID=2952 RepID=A0A812XK57_SYMPI|nr:unnamed protein product [Symbiodinium pilosum]